MLHSLIGRQGHAINARIDGEHFDLSIPPLPGAPQTDRHRRHEKPGFGDDLCYGFCLDRAEAGVGHPR
jgi:hypothetical protein